VLGRAQPAGSVARRDFRQPRRLGPARLQELEQALKNALPALERKLAESAGLPVSLRIAGLGEADADAFLAEAPDAPCVLRFRCQRAPAPAAPAWLAWDPAAAVQALEAILGSRKTSAASPAATRRLSPTEARLASQLLIELVRGLAPVLGLTASDFTLVQLATELGSWREAGAEAEPHRVELRLDLELGGHPSRVRLCVPGVERGDPAPPPPLEELPAHLERVEVELCAYLPGCDITLDQLLALEEGDVIPLEARLGDSTLLEVEGLTLAHARLGSHRGRLALRIEHLSLPPLPA